MGVREIVEAHVSRFIEFDQLLKAIAEAEGDGVTVSAVAVALAAKDALRDVSVHHDSEYGRVHAGDGGARMLRFLLRHASCPESAGPVPDGMNPMDEWGVLKDEVAPALEAAGISVSPLVAD